MFWKRARAHFRNVDSYDEAEPPVKATYFEGESAYDVNANPRDKDGGKRSLSHAVENSRSATPPERKDSRRQGLVHVKSRTRSFDMPSSAEDLDDASEPQNDRLVSGRERPVAADNSFLGKGPMDRKRMIVILVCLFLLGVALLASGIAVRKKNKRSNNVSSIDRSEGATPVPTTSTSLSPRPTSVPVDSPSTNSPTTSLPTYTPSQLEGMDLWIETLSGITDPRTLRQDSPQNRAMQWISSEDGAKMDPRTTPTTELTERYIAAVLYFTTDGEEWAESFNFLSGDTVCTWNFGGPNGITCNGNGSVSSVFIVDNNLKGTIPSEINHLVNLETMNMYYNDLTGSIPDFGNLLTLQQIDLAGNMLSGNVPESLFNLPSLELLLLPDNPELTGNIPEITSEAPSLQRISFYNCNLTGKLPASLGRASDLTFLQFFDNDLTGSIPSSLTTLPKLTSLSLRGNQLSGSIPSFGGQASLETISLGENQLQGSLPSGLGDLSGLTTCYLDKNNLTGDIPAEISSMPMLQSVWLFGNRFEGPLPTFANNPGTLEQVYLNDNQFTGTLDSLIEQSPTSIRFLELGGNSQVTGSLSGSISRFTFLVQFNVSFTGVTGTIPQVVSSLDLNLLSLHGTDITGDLTAIMCPDGTTTTSLTVLTADCGGLSPTVDCACCTECCATTTTTEGGTGSTVCEPNNR